MSDDADSRAASLEEGAGGLNLPDVPNTDPEDDIQVVYLLRDRCKTLTDAWSSEFANDTDRVKVSCGDIFRENAPAADAIVSPANSFGFMDGGIDMVYSRHFGWQMQERLQKVIREDYDGEILVGQAAIIPTFEGGATETSMKWTGSNEGQPIYYLISAPTMRVPLEVDDTVNAYSAFRAIILSVQKHNKKAESSGERPIRTVLCPGLGTAVGRMPHPKCAHQMKIAFDVYEMGKLKLQRTPKHLEDVWQFHIDMASVSSSNKTKKQQQLKSALSPPPKAKSSTKESSKESNKKPWNSCVLLTFWLVVAIIVLIGGIWLEMKLGARFERQADVLEDLVDEGADVPVEEPVYEGEL